MNQTPPELLAPYKAALVAAGRDAIRAIRETGGAGARYEIPGTVPPALVVVGDEAEIARLLRAPVREPMLGGRRVGDPPAPALTFDEPAASEPRRWTILLTSEGHGLVGAQGNTFEAAHERHERLDVVEAEPVLREVAELRATFANVRLVGAMMANTMFNLSQRRGTVVDDRLATSMKEMQQDWDTAVRALPQQAAQVKED